MAEHIVGTAGSRRGSRRLLVIVVPPVYGADAATGGQAISAPCAAVYSSADRREPLLVVGHRVAEKGFLATAADRQALLGFG